MHADKVMRAQVPDRGQEGCPAVWRSGARGGRRHQGVSPLLHAAAAETLVLFHYACSMQAAGIQLQVAGSVLERQEAPAAPAVSCKCLVPHEPGSDSTTAE